MYAVIKTGGKQYRVVAGEKLKVEQIPADVGTEITLDQVLMVGEGESVRIGSPASTAASDPIRYSLFSDMTVVTREWLRAAGARE